MVFKTVIRNMLGTERRLLWLRGLTIDANGFQAVDGCWPDRCNDSDRCGFLNELQGGSIQVCYATDMPTIHSDNLQKLLNGEQIINMPQYVAPQPTVEEVLRPVDKPVAPDVLKKVEDRDKPAEGSDQVPANIRSLQDKAQHLYGDANRPVSRFGETVISKETKAAQLDSKVAVEGVMEDFAAEHVAFTADDAQSLKEFPGTTEAFPDRPFKPTADNSPMFQAASIDEVKSAPAAPEAKAESAPAAAGQSRRGVSKKGK